MMNIIPLQITHKSLVGSHFEKALWLFMTRQKDHCVSRMTQPGTW